MVDPPPLATRELKRMEGSLLRPAAPMVIAALLQAACYNYVPRQRSQLEPSMYVAVTLTSEGSDALAQYLGPDVAVVRGIFQGVREQGYGLSVWSVMGHRGEVLAWKGETVSVPRLFVRSVEERQPSRSKSILLGVAFLGGFFTVTRAFGLGSSGSSPTVSGSGTGSR